MKRRPNVILCLVALALAADAWAQEPPEVGDDWKTIFGGENLEGWEVPFGEFWTIEDGTIHASMPEGASFDRRKSRGNWTWIMTRRRYRKFHLALEARVEKGMFAMVHWGTLKQYLGADFLSPGWHDIRMTWSGGEVLLWVDGAKIDVAGRARGGDNTREFYLLVDPGTEAWFRNVRVLEIEPGEDPKPRRGDPDPDPAAAPIFDGTLDGWRQDGDWEAEKRVLRGRADRTPVWIRTEDRTFERGKLSFEYRGDSRATSLTVLLDISEDGRRMIRMALPASGRGWRRIEIELKEREVVLYVDGRPIDRGRRGEDGGGIGFHVAARAGVEVKDLEFEAADD